MLKPIEIPRQFKPYGESVQHPTNVPKRLAVS